MNIWEIPATVSSWTLSLRELALGANFIAYFMTTSGNVAEKSRIWTVPGSILGKNISKRSKDMRMPWQAYCLTRAHWSPKPC